MDLWQSWKVIARRWYVVVPILAVTVVMMILVPRGVDPEYEASASITLVGRTQDVSGDLTLSNNPLVPSGSLGAPAHATGVAVSGAGSRQAIAAVGLYSDYDVVSDARTPIVVIEAAGSDAGIAVDTVDTVIDVFRRDLRDRQTRLGVSPENFIDVEVLAEPAVSGPSNSAKIRTMLVVGALGVAFAVAAAFAAEGIAVLRRRRARASDVSGEHPGDTPPEDTRPVDTQEALVADATPRSTNGDAATVPEPVREPKRAAKESKERAERD